MELEDLIKSSKNEPDSNIINWMSFFVCKKIR